MPSFIFYKLLEACREPGCPLCRVEQQSVERYLNNQFYENVNNPAWRNRLRESLGFCRDHAWLGVNKRLGDALGYSIIYHDLANSVLKHLENPENGAHPSRRGSWPGQSPNTMRMIIERVSRALTPRRRCPVCEHSDEMTQDYLSSLIQDLSTPEMLDALKASDGLCLPHFRRVIQSMENMPLYEELVTMQREKLEGLRAELAEFIRKSDYQAIQEGFGSEGDAWLRALRMVIGSRKET